MPVENQLHQIASTVPTTITRRQETGERATLSSPFLEVQKMPVLQISKRYSHPNRLAKPASSLRLLRRKVARFAAHSERSSESCGALSPLI